MTSLKFCRRAAVALASAAIALTGSLSASFANDHVKAGVVRSLGGSPSYIGVDKGFFAAEGIDVEIVFFESAPPLALGVASGDLDFANTGATAAFFNLAAQGTFKFLTSGTWETPGFQSTGFLVSNQAYDAGLHSLKDIAAKNAAITQSGTPLHYVLGLAAEKYGIDFKNVHVLLLQANPNVASALTSGQADIGVQTVAPAYAVIEKGGARLLGWVGDELGRQQVETLFTSTKTANERGDLVKRYLAGYRKAMAYYHDAFADANDKRHDGPNADEVIGILSKYLQQTPDVIKKGVPFIDSQGRMVPANFAKLAAWYKEQGMLKADIDVNSLIDKRYTLVMP